MISAMVIQVTVRTGTRTSMKAKTWPTALTHLINELSHICWYPPASNNVQRLCYVIYLFKLLLLNYYPINYSH